MERRLDDFPSVRPEDIKLEDFQTSFSVEEDKQKFANLLAGQSQEKIEVLYIAAKEDVKNRSELAMKYKQLFDAEVGRIKDDLEMRFDTAMNRVSAAQVEFLSGQYFSQLAKLLWEKQWMILVKGEKVIAYKSYFNQPLAVTKSRSSTEVKTYAEPMCHVLAIHVNLTHTMVGDGTVIIQSEGRHPNANAAGQDADLSSFCTGGNGGTGIRGRSIPIDKPDKLAGFLFEVEDIVSYGHPESAYYSEAFNKSPVTHTEPVKLWKTKKSKATAEGVAF